MTSSDALLATHTGIIPPKLIVTTRIAVPQTTQFAALRKVSAIPLLVPRAKYRRLAHTKLIVRDGPAQTLTMRRVVMALLNVARIHVPPDSLR